MVLFRNTGRSDGHSRRPKALLFHNYKVLVKYKPIRIENKYEHWIEDDYFSEIKYRILIKRKSLFVIQNYVKSRQAKSGKVG